MTLYC